MNKHVRTDAFTMIEAVTVIIVLSILVLIAIPRLKRDIRQEAKETIVSALRYTQHLSLSDNIINPNSPKWQRKFWRFGKQGCSDNGIFFYIASDKDEGGNISELEAAINPRDGKWYNAINTAPCESDLSEQVFNDGTRPSDDIFLTKRFGIKEDDTTMFANCGGQGSGKYIGFDYLGRPHIGFANSTSADYSSILRTDCTLIFKFVDSSIPDLNITIEKETGFIRAN